MIDCMQACEVISAAHDGELVDAAALAAARAHAESCAECAAFVRVLDRIGSAPRPGAPAQLVARLGRIAEPDRASRRERERFAWLPRAVALTSAAAVLLVVASVGGIALLSRTAQTADEEAVKRVGGDEALMAAPSAEMAEDAASTFAGAAVQPAFVSLDSVVWALTGVADAAPANLTPAGSVLSALGSGSLVERAASYPGDDRSELYVADDDGGYHIFSRVVRTLGGKRYGLMTAAPVHSFGEWPTLPGAHPERADGSPVFEPAGYDDLGVQVFAPPGAGAAYGFAIAPGTAPDDPAAGNPGWTWWEPLP